MTGWHFIKVIVINEEVDLPGALEAGDDNISNRRDSQVSQLRGTGEASRMTKKRGNNPNSMPTVCWPLPRELSVFDLSNSLWEPKLPSNLLGSQR